MAQTCHFKISQRNLYTSKSESYGDKKHGER